MKKHFKKFIVTGVLILLTNIFWDSISPQVEKIPYVQKSMQFIGDLFETKEPPFNAIESVTKGNRKLTVRLKEESFVYLFSKEGNQAKQLFPTRTNTFNQYNPNFDHHISYQEDRAKLYLVASRNPMKKINIAMIKDFIVDFILFLKVYYRYTWRRY